MRTLIILVVGLLAIGCLSPEQKQKALMDSVVGVYELYWKGWGGTGEIGHTYKFVLLDNGILESCIDGKIRTPKNTKVCHQVLLMDGSGFD